MNEVFQFQHDVEYLMGKRKKTHPEYVPTVRIDELKNHETNSITEEIRMILDLLGDEVFVGVVELTDPEIGIPVVELISDYEPRHSLVSKEEMNEFFLF